MEEQVMEYASGNEMAAMAVRQIGYDLMGYYPITPSTQIAEQLDADKAAGKIDLLMIPAEGEHSAAGICYGASVGGGRVFNATSANGLLYALEQLPVQSGTRYPMVMNVVCRTVSGPLSIKGDHSDIMYMLNAGWLLFFAHSVQEVYDFNIIALRLAEQIRLPAVVAYDGFFTSHQKRRCYRFKAQDTVRRYIGHKREPYPFFDLEHPVTVGGYMNEDDLMENRYQLHEAMEEARTELPKLFREYEVISGRSYQVVEGYAYQDAKILLVLLGSSYETAMEAVEQLRKEGKQVGAVTLHSLRPFPEKEISQMCRQANTIVVADRQDSYGAGGGNLSLEIRAAIQKYGGTVHVKSLVYGLGGRDFFVEDAKHMLQWAEDKSTPDFAYYEVQEKNATVKEPQKPWVLPVTGERIKLGLTTIVKKAGEEELHVLGGNLNATTEIPKRLAPGHGACPGCGIPVNLNLLLRGIEDPVILLFQTGCGMIVTTPYPKTSFKVPYVHNLFQNGAATLSGLAEIYKRRQQQGELPAGELVFIMVSGDGGMDIGMGSALGTAFRGHHLLLFEYDNGGYMNTGYQLSYSTPLGAKSSTSHIGVTQYGKGFFHKDMPQIMAAANVPYVATAAESNPADFIRKAAKAAEYAKHSGVAYVKALSACPLNWNDNPAKERSVIEMAVDTCYFPLYEVENGKTILNYNPERAGKKQPVREWLAMMGRTKHLIRPEYAEVVDLLQQEVDRRYYRLVKQADVSSSKTNNKTAEK